MTTSMVAAAGVITDDSADGEETDDSVSMSLTSVAAGVISDDSADGAESVKTFISVDVSDGIAPGGQTWFWSYNSYNLLC